ncbi:glycosyltransferase [Xenorhabdus szentirmaii]|uniref:Glycosyltransferase group 1 n=1 Tax=Xenorhabdus szentirmaii DSM 16338 TaxID=1427518 RepID=W1J212_9GAMM|nr:glycosyltransferase [Xenorhabdus szentirmaii]PHM34340.1 putative UDP-galactose--lipooligosaccharide galactosyltransferase [Xenorhabdus szentirmaii DSM 16338]CDL84103.1 Glycosyltransferase group 1 [Xenorhabdus szentirmaii DSM 16338]
MSKKLVFLTESMVGAGGVVRVISTWANYFSKIGFNCKIISVVPGEPYFPLEIGVSFNIRKYFFNKKILFLPINLFLILPILKEARNSYLVVNKSAYIEPIYFWRKLGFFKDIRLVYFAHGGNNEFESFYMVRRTTKHRVKMIFDVFNHVICLFKNTENTPKIVKDEKITFISNPCPLPTYIRKKDECNKIVTYIGRITKEKGVDNLIKAWGIIEEKYEDWKLEIIGDGHDKKEFIELSENLKLKNISFFESTNNITHYFRRATISVLPSLFEGLPLSIIEAKSQGCAVISTRTNGGKKLIKNMENGILVDIANVEDLANKIILLIDDYELRYKLINQSYSDMPSFEIAHLAKNWENIFNNDI